jgi:type I restriction enzyme S subunit
MTFDLQVTTLRDLMNLDSGYPFKGSAWVKSGTPVIKIKNVQDGYVDLEGCSYVDEETAQKAAGWYGKIGNILIALTGAGVGEIGRIHNGQAGLINQRVGWVRPKNLEDEDYIYYLLRHFKSKIIELASGSAQPNVSPNAILDLKCEVPIESERKSIGRILSALDAKISLNKELSKTLEDLAQTVFKSWFIDFDPVRKKMSGEKPNGVSEEVEILFPDKLEKSEVGFIPAGWKVKFLQEVVDLSWGDTKTTKSAYIADGYPAYSAKGQDGYLPNYDYDEIGIVLSAIGANCGKTWIALGKWSCIKNTIRIIALKDGANLVPYVYLRTKKPESWERRGTAQPFISQEDARSIKLITPPSNIIDKFNELVLPLFELISKQDEQNIVLTGLRDSLLPRLISGELQMPDEMRAS